MMHKIKSQKCIPFAKMTTIVFSCSDKFLKTLMTKHENECNSMPS